MSQQQPDQFVKWMLGIAASVVVIMGASLMSTTLSLREDMAVIKSELVNVRKDVATVSEIQDQLANHEYRLRWIEQSDPNHQSKTKVARYYKFSDSIYTQSP